MTENAKAEILVKAVDVCKSFGTFKALDNVSLEVRKGEVCCIVGPSGSGKSTFLRCINLLERLDSGAIWANGEVLDVMNDLATSGMTMIVVTHEMGFARNVSNNVAFMDGGKLIEYGPSEKVLTQPDNPRTADFLRAVQR